MHDWPLHMRKRSLSESRVGGFHDLIAKLWVFFLDSALLTGTSPGGLQLLTYILRLGHWGVYFPAQLPTQCFACALFKSGPSSHGKRLSYLSKAGEATVFAGLRKGGFGGESFRDFLRGGGGARILNGSTWKTLVLHKETHREE